MRSRPRSRSLLPLSFALALAAVLPGRAARADEDLDNWIPSLGIGFGIYSREVEGSIDGLMKSDVSSSAPEAVFQCDDAGFCPMASDDTRTVDGGSLSVSAQLLGPPFALPRLPESVNLRPFVSGGWARNFASRLVTGIGFQPDDFDLGALEPDIRMKIDGDSQYLWFVSTGGAVRLPFSRPIFAKLGISYIEERLDMSQSIVRGRDGVPGLLKQKVKDELDIRGLGPFFGLEVEVARFGPLGLQFCADAMVGFPLNNAAETNLIPQALFENEQNLVTEPVTFDYDAENPLIYGLGTLRFSWLGR